MLLSRYFRFRLRTLMIAVLVLSVPLAWVAYSLNWIRERHRLIGEEAVRFLRERGEPIDGPAGLWIFGEPGAFEFLVEAEQARQRYQRLFPEATVYGPMTDGPGSEF